MPLLKSVINAAGLVGAVAGQYFPPTPEGLKVINSKHQEGVKISYKEVGDRHICSCPNSMLTELFTSLVFAKPPQVSNRTRVTCIFPRVLSTMCH